MIPYLNAVVSIVTFGLPSLHANTPTLEKHLTTTVQESKILPKVDLDRLISTLKKSFIHLQSADQKTFHCWGIIYKRADKTGALVRSLDAYRYQSSSQVISVSSDSTMIGFERWDFVSPDTTRAISLDFDRFLKLPFEGTVSGTLVYPGRDGNVKDTKFELTIRKPDSSKFELIPMVTYTLPGDHDSGIAMFVQSDGKVKPITIDSSDITVADEHDLNFQQINPVYVSDIKGKRGTVSSGLANIDALNVIVYAKDDLYPSTDSDIKAYVETFLNEEVPRLVISASASRADVKFGDEYVPRNRIERESIVNLLGTYEKRNLPTLLVSISRNTNGLLMVEIQIVARVQSNAGLTMAYLYKDYIYGTNTDKSDISREYLKKLIQRFADQWIKANPREKDK